MKLELTGELPLNFDIREERAPGTFITLESLVIPATLFCCCW